MPQVVWDSNVASLWGTWPFVQSIFSSPLDQQHSYSEILPKKSRWKEFNWCFIVLAKARNRDVFVFDLWWAKGVFELTRVIECFLRTHYQFGRLEWYYHSSLQSFENRGRVVTCEPWGFSWYDVMWWVAPMSTIQGGGCGMQITIHELSG